MYRVNGLGEREGDEWGKWGFIASLSGKGMRSRDHERVGLMEGPGWGMMLVVNCY